MPKSKDHPSIQPTLKSPCRDCFAGGKREDCRAGCKRLNAFQVRHCGDECNYNPAHDSGYRLVLS